MADVPIRRMLEGFGIEAEPSRAAALRALVDAGVISGKAGRKNIASSKSDVALETLQAAFAWHCNGNDCKAEAAASGDATLLTNKKSCGVCGGSNDRNALRRMAEACREAGVSRVLVVGGTDNKRRELEDKKPPGVEWRLVDGTKSRKERHARPDLDWAQVVVIWASTELDHKVSSHYDLKGDPRVITVRARGISRLANEVASHVLRR